MAVNQASKFGSRMAVSLVLLPAVVAGGIATLLFFWGQLLRPGELSSVSLPVVALVAGVAATFNPCGLPALPGFLTFLGGGEQATAGRRLGLSASVSLGAMSPWLSPWASSSPSSAEVPRNW